MICPTNPPLVRMCWSRGPPPTSGASSPSLSCLRVACRARRSGTACATAACTAIHRGVYAVGHRKLPLEGRFLAAVKACGPGAVLSHVSAAALWGFMPWDGALPRGDRASATGAARAPGPARSTGPRSLDRDDITRHHGIPVTSPARTLLDLAATLDDKPLRARHPPRPVALPRQRPPARRGPGPPPGKTGRGQAGEDHRHRPRAHPERARGRRARPHPARRPRPSRRQRRRCYSTAGASSPTSAGPSSASSSRPTAQRGTTTSSRARTTPSARRCWRRTASGSCASRGRRRSRVRRPRSPGSARRARPTLSGR